MDQTEQAGFIFWVAQPPAATDLSLLYESADVAEAFLALRYGDAAYRRTALRNAARMKLPGLTVAADLDDHELIADMADSRSS